jgi:hypothetical protein
MQRRRVNFTLLGCALTLAAVLGCSRSQPASAPVPTPPAAVIPTPPVAVIPTPPAAVPAAKKQLRATGVQKMNFPNGDSALILNYETDIPIDNKQALTAEVTAIWTEFQHDVEKAGVNTGVIRATHNETTGILSTGKGYGFVFKKDADGKWRLQTDDAGK